MLADDLTTLLSSKKAALVAFADLCEIPSDVREALPVGISIAVALNPQIIADIHAGPTRAYYDEYLRVNQILDGLGRTAAEFLRGQGYMAISFAATYDGHSLPPGVMPIEVDPNTHASRLPHKTVATRAGLGWIGKCALLVTEPYGSAVRLTTVLTDAELPPGEPVDTSRCGECRVCVDTCPAHAPSGKNWRVDMSRDDFFDAFACQKTARELAAARIGITNTICGRCIVTCPWTKKYLSLS
jgi:epoxyqueuosine reductase